MTNEDPQALTPLRLKKNEERRIRRGHQWVYSNEIDTKATPLKGLEPGCWVRVEDYRGQELGTGYANPASLICARIMSRDRSRPISESLLVHRLKVALGLRERLFSAPFYRLVYGESDGLPGLVIDRFDQLLVLQISTAGMEAMREALLDALQKVLKPEVIVLRNDLDSRSLEGLEQKTEIIHGALNGPVEILEGPARFVIDPLGGQKTGWFYDQRDNRQRAARYCEGARVLDLFSYIGSFAMNAALGGAESVLSVDSSEKALDQLLTNAALNGVEEQVSALQGDAFEALKMLRDEQHRFDVVMVDPPAFVRRRKDLKEGENAYRRVNEAAMRLLERDGIIVASSCSFHMPRENLARVLHEAARHLGRQLQILEHGHQGPDHPMHPAMPETEYLKTIVARVVRS